MAEAIDVSVRDGVAEVALNRPDKLNGLTLAMLRDLAKLARELRRDRSLRAVVLRGNGESFCAGLDFATATRQPRTAARMFVPNPLRATNIFQEACWGWRRVPVPVITEVHGHCYGGGLQLAVGADFRFTTPDAEWSVLEGKWGLIPDMSGVRGLSELVGIDTAKRLTMTAEMISGTRAAEIGLATEAVDSPAAASAEVIDLIRKKSPDAVAAAKRLFNESWTAGERKTFRAERRRQLRLLVGTNSRAALKAGISNQAPKYGPRGRRI